MEKLWLYKISDKKVKAYKHIRLAPKVDRKRYATIPVYKTPYKGKWRHKDIKVVRGWNPIMKKWQNVKLLVPIGLYEKYESKMWVPNNASY